MDSSNTAEKETTKARVDSKAPSSKDKKGGRQQTDSFSPLVEKQKHSGSEIISNEQDSKRNDNIELLPLWEHSAVNEADIIPFGVIHKKSSENGGEKVYQSVEDALTQAYELQQFVEKVLTEGIDYGMIKGYSKPSLFKSGAERLCRFFGVVPVVEIKNRLENYSRPLFCYEARMELISRSAGAIQATGIGLSNSREGCYKMSDVFAIQNTILKMAKKRALIDAVLNLSGLSSRFTQDVEDFRYDGPGYLSGMVKSVTRQQYTALCAIIKEKQLSEDGFKELLMELFHVASWKALNYEQMETFIAVLNKYQ